MKPKSMRHMKNPNTNILQKSDYVKGGYSSNVSNLYNPVDYAKNSNLKFIGSDNGANVNASSALRKSPSSYLRQSNMSTRVMPKRGGNLSKVTPLAAIKDLT